MVVVALTASTFFSLPDIIRSNSSAASPRASGDAAEIITGTSSVPIRFNDRSARRVRGSGARLTLAIGSDIGRTTLSNGNVIASGSNAVIKSATC